MSPTGKIFDEPMAVYHASDAFGVHDLDDLTPHPLLFWKKHVKKSIPPDKDSPALAFGRYFHTLALEGEEAAERDYVQIPEGIDRRTKEGKLAWAQFEAQLGNRQAIGADDYKLAWRMVEAIREKPSLCALLDPKLGRPEVTFRCQMKHFQLQCRVDWWVESTLHDVNLKTIEHLADFDKHFFNYGYYRGAAFYRAVIAKVMGCEPSQPQSSFLVVEKSEPFQAVIREPDAESIRIGWQEVERELLKLRDCFESNNWPGEPDEPKPVSLPIKKIKESQ